MNNTEDYVELLYDTDLMAVGCVLLQACAGCNTSDVYRFGFDTCGWLTAPTPGLRRIRGTYDEWRKVAEMTNRKWRGKRADTSKHYGDNRQ